MLIPFYRRVKLAAFSAVSAVKLFSDAAAY